MTHSRKALLLLDYQVALCEEGPHLRMPPLAAQVAERGVLVTAEKVLAAARTAGWLVVHVRLAFDPSYVLRTNRLARFDAYPDQRAMLTDSPEAKIVQALAPLPGEPVVDKGCVDPFVGTPLLQVLAAEGVGEVVLGGVATNLVVESAARHASDAGLQVTVVEDMCASFRPDFHEFSVANMLPLFGTVTSAEELLGSLA
ncbi:isochorismatase family protein [Nocardioides sp. zg-579]|uniref:Isochorismatase family protein n=1 Tax=Nocardioides marmotae TaxID=2663857 RepID=A0A6I3JEL5_9ACTN|nr:cysteine hydrolase [Nocardioides marmotae]MCR6032833.1 isochorismatase family protein [Gordonia jinghuaiqii]MTB96483.1 isochorismatase family protein [Nocardioides marmotae]QKE01994.1 cysteine hydrolase [Nocardioides marmotae]